MAEYGAERPSDLLELEQEDIADLVEQARPADRAGGGTGGAILDRARGPQQAALCRAGAACLTASPRASFRTAVHKRSDRDPAE